MLDRMTAGEIPAKHHVVFRDAEERLIYEECLTREGFDGPYTILYHQRRPHTELPLGAADGWPAPQAVEGRALSKRHYRTGELESRGGTPLNARVPLLFNDDLVVSSAKPDSEDEVYFINGDADDLIYVHQGEGVLRSPLGDLPYGPEDYLTVPRGLLHRFVPAAGSAQNWLTMECLGGLWLPKQWRNAVGQLRMDAPFCHRDFRRPEFHAPRDEGIRKLVVKRGGAFHAFELEDSPLDVVGWDGSVYPFAFPIRNFQPRAGQVHLPPTWHGNFAARGALVCSFVPRMVDFHDDAIPCPYPHTSVDCDEIIFYVSGDFTSREGVGPGSISHHPAGVTHGPHPGAYEASIGSQRTSEMAVMVDTFKPLHTTAAAVATEDAGYPASFREKRSR